MGRGRGPSCLALIKGLLSHQIRLRSGDQAANRVVEQAVHTPQHDQACCDDSVPRSQAGGSQASEPRCCRPLEAHTYAAAAGTSAPRSRERPTAHHAVPAGSRVHKPVQGAGKDGARAARDRSVPQPPRLLVSARWATALASYTPAAMADHDHAWASGLTAGRCEAGSNLNPKTRGSTSKGDSRQRTIVVCFSLIVVQGKPLLR